MRMTETVPDRKPDTDIEFVITSDNDGWYRSELKVAGKVVTTSFTGRFENALDLFREAFPVDKSEDE